MLRTQRKLLLIALDWTRPKDPPLSLGHGSILAYALQQKIHVHERSWAVNAKSFHQKDVTEHILARNNPYLDVAFGVFIWNEAAIQKILQDLKNRNFLGRIILGGPQISYTKQNLEKLYPQADAFIRGYAEMALINLVNNNEDDATIPGVHFAGQTDMNTQATVDLKSLPSPYLHGVIQPQRFIRWETQRGCKFRCSFCQHRGPKNTTTDKAFDPDRIQKEIQWILNNPIIQDIAVLDPVINSGEN